MRANPLQGHNLQSPAGEQAARFCRDLQDFRQIAISLSCCLLASAMGKFIA
jgi:hypothetical protein